MPVDHRRITGPENTVPYELYSILNTESLKTQFEKIVKLDNTRCDGRKLGEHRKIFMKTGVVSQAKGSAYIELNDTKVIVSVFDPREIPNKTDYSLKGEIYCEFKFAPFSCNKRRLHQQDNEEKQYSAVMKQALEPAILRQEFPNFQVDIYALVLQNDGAALSAAITAAGLALAHAGIPMYDIITSATIAVQGDVRLLDPTQNEQDLCQLALYPNDSNDNNHGIIVLAVLSTHEQVSQLYQTGNASLECLSECVEKLLKASKEIVPLVEKCLAKHVLKTAQSVRED